jgi:hypothetical protein
MKQFIVILTIIFGAFSLSAQEKDIKTESIKVEGNCNMCKKRIEQAAFVKGVKRAEWDKETHILSVVYRPSKTTMATVAQSIAKAGHSSERLEAKEKDYKGLPACCQYKDHICND